MAVVRMIRRRQPPTPTPPTARRDQEHTLSEMSKAERDQMIALSRRRARQAEREADMRQKVLYAEVIDLMTAQFSAEDRLWAEAVNIARQIEEKIKRPPSALCS